MNFCLVHLLKYKFTKFLNKKKTNIVIIFIANLVISPLCVLVVTGIVHTGTLFPGAGDIWARKCVLSCRLVLSWGYGRSFQTMRDSIQASDRSGIEAGDISVDHCCLVWSWMLRWECWWDRDLFYLIYIRSWIRENLFKDQLHDVVDIICNDRKSFP